MDQPQWNWKRQPANNLICVVRAAVVHNDRLPRLFELLNREIEQSFTERIGAIVCRYHNADIHGLLLQNRLKFRLMAKVSASYRNSRYPDASRSDFAFSL